MASQTTTRRGTTLTVLDRELIRCDETFSNMKAENKWNRKTIKLALKFMKFEDVQAGIGSILMDS